MLSQINANDGVNSSSQAQEIATHSKIQEKKTIKINTDILNLSLEIFSSFFEYLDTKSIQHFLSSCSILTQDIAPKYQIAWMNQNVKKMGLFDKEELSKIEQGISTELKVMDLSKNLTNKQFKEIIEYALNRLIHNKFIDNSTSSSRNHSKISTKLSNIILGIPSKCAMVIKIAGICLSAKDDSNSSLKTSIQTIARFGEYKLACAEVLSRTEYLRRNTNSGSLWHVKREKCYLVNTLAHLYSGRSLEDLFNLVEYLASLTKDKVKGGYVASVSLMDVAFAMLIVNRQEDLNILITKLWDDVMVAPLKASQKKNNNALALPIMKELDSTSDVLWSMEEIVAKLNLKTKDPNKSFDFTSNISALVFDKRRSLSELLDIGNVRSVKWDHVIYAIASAGPKIRRAFEIIEILEKIKISDERDRIVCKASCIMALAGYSSFDLSLIILQIENLNVRDHCLSELAMSMQMSTYNQSEIDQVVHQIQNRQLKANALDWIHFIEEWIKDAKAVNSSHKKRAKRGHAADEILLKFKNIIENRTHLGKEWNNQWDEVSHSSSNSSSLISENFADLEIKISQMASQGPYEWSLGDLLEIVNKIKEPQEKDSIIKKMIFHMALSNYKAYDLHIALFEIEDKIERSNFSKELVDIMHTVNYQISDILEILNSNNDQPVYIESASTAIFRFNGLDAPSNEITTCETFSNVDGSNENIQSKSEESSLQTLDETEMEIISTLVPSISDGIENLKTLSREKILENKVLSSIAQVMIINRLPFFDINKIKQEIEKNLSNILEIKLNFLEKMGIYKNLMHSSIPFQLQKKLIDDITNEIAKAASEDIKNIAIGMAISEYYNPFDSEGTYYSTNDIHRLCYSKHEGLCYSSMIEEILCKLAFDGFDYKKLCCLTDHIESEFDKELTGIKIAQRMANSSKKYTQYEIANFLIICMGVKD